MLVQQTQLEDNLVSTCTMNNTTVHVQVQYNNNYCSIPIVPKRVRSVYVQCAPMAVLYLCGLLIKIFLRLRAFTWREGALANQANRATLGGLTSHTFL